LKFRTGGERKAIKGAKETEKQRISSQNAREKRVF
jgi:hypothetical protein